jgi:hypothetical protein
MEELFAIFGVEIDPNELDEQAYNDIINDLHVIQHEGSIYVGLSPEDMDEDETLYAFKERIVAILVDYLPYITEEDITFIAKVF